MCKTEHDGPQEKHTWYIRDEGGVLLATYVKEKTEPTAQLEEQYVYGDQRLGWYEPATQQHYYELKDHQGSVRQVLKDDGTRMHVADYYPFGKLQNDKFLDGEENSRFTYQGEFAELDPESGLLHFESREYDLPQSSWSSGEVEKK
ncbi:MAG: hypothetical protein HC842_08125 [Cytophagales bacterium]|nr:hypothetical protein [Cytophagales bacterium]